MSRTAGQKKQPSSHQPHRDFLIALNGLLDGKSLQEIAVDLFPTEHVNTIWNEGEWLKSRVRRRVNRGRYFMNGGYLELLNRNL